MIYSRAKHIAALLCCCILLTYSAIAFAEETGMDSVAPAAEQESMELSAAVADAAKPEPVDPGMEIEALLREYNTSGMGALFQDKMDRGQLFYTIARARVRVDPSDPNWANFRNSAFDEAMLNAQAAYMLEQNKSVRAETLKHVKNDPAMPKFKREELGSTSKFGELLDKAIAVAGSKLDSMLEENGLDPNRFKALPKTKQKTLLFNAIEKRTYISAYAKLSGMTIVQTFEACNSAGKHEVAVAVVSSPKFKSWVTSILTNKGDLPANPRKVGGPTVRELVGHDKAALFQQFGIRRVYDQDGYPVLISYGQSGNPYHGNDYDQRAEQRELAFDRADSNAQANFAFLLNANGTYDKKVIDKTISETIGKVELQSDGTSSPRTSRTNKFLTAMNKKIRAKGSISNFPGIHKLTSWTYKHPEYNQEIVGVVYMWSPKTNNLARALRKNTTVKKKTPKQASGTAKAVMGQELMDVDDF